MAKKNDTVGATPDKGVATPTIEEEKIRDLKTFYEIDPDAPYYPTGLTLMDEIVGGGMGMGYAGGKFYNLGGDTSSGKTFVAWHSIAANVNYWGQKKVPFKWMYDDAENGSTLAVDVLYGLDDYEDHVVHSKTMEKLLANIDAFLGTLEKGERGIYVIDSLDPIKTQTDIDNIEKGIAITNEDKVNKTGSYELTKQKFLSSQFFPYLSARLLETSAIIIIISQVRYNITGMGAKFNISGGKAADHNYNSRIIVSKQGLYDVTREGNSITIGMGIRMKMSKNKCPRPARECQVDIYFTRGIDDVGSCIDYLYDAKTPTGGGKKGAKLVWDDLSFSSTKAMANHLYENHLVPELRKRTVEKWERIEAQGVAEANSRLPEQTWDWSERE